MSRLSRRLLTVAGMMPKCVCVCDVGTDHGYLPIYLINEGVCDIAYALDVRKGPLSRAISHVQEAGLSDRITLMLSDGLDALMDEKKGNLPDRTLPDVIVMAGMGGPLMEDILTRGSTIARSAKKLVLSPQSHVPEFRGFLYDEGYHIADERMVYEDGKYYFILLVEPDTSNNKSKSENAAAPTAAELRYGAPLIKRRDPILWDYLDAELLRLKKVEAQLNQSGVTDRLSEIEEEISIIEKIKHS